ncbi:DUF29 domain-containing protein [Pseudanabaena sp. FACHB-1998]|uniref:DUF29 domain-containing protein n=1 Tax=Pseudanabaena sp. FACHB-1998 TaxID=2692858 RepID=UPI0016802FB6|nr:DUF29 domain-containing protein [Pseudanabaena sp. FACHB-1998]MBD2178761.1 DUF29 domain-containing protein [Pseudanabaena sp. FACHB-1998]
MTQAITRKSLYESDFLRWTEETVAKLKAKDFDHVDLENLIEEIESLGRSEKKEVRNRLKTLLEHLIKRIYVDMPQEFNGWERTIREQRAEIRVELNDMPSLKRFWEELFDVAWGLALLKVKDEYEKKGYYIPEQWQFSREIDAMLSVKFWDE